MSEPRSEFEEIAFIERLRVRVPALRKLRFLELRPLADAFMDEAYETLRAGLTSAAEHCEAEWAEEKDPSKQGALLAALLLRDLLESGFCIRAGE